MSSRQALSKPIKFWERIAFRIALGFILPMIVSSYALYSLSGIYGELLEAKDQAQINWNSIRFTSNKAALNLAKIRLHSQAMQYERSTEVAKQLEVTVREFEIDVKKGRKILEDIAAENGMRLDRQLEKNYLQLNELQRDLSRDVSSLIGASSSLNAGEVGRLRKEIEHTGYEMELVMGRINAYYDRLDGLVTDRITEADQRSRRTLVFYLILIFILGLGAAAFVSISITAPVRQVLLRIKDIANGDGDLTRRVTTRAGGEMRELAAWLNVFLEKTHGIISTIAQASATVRDTTTQVGTQAETMTVAAAGISKNMLEQSMNIDECTSRVGNIDNLIQNSGESTRQAASLSKIAMDRALQGGASVHETIEAMEKIEESARKVEELVSSINEVASQTNLLAINAAIEATKAGEHGKGFAVVAEEVRRLAERARKITAEVTKLVSESSERVTAGVGLARAAGVSLDGIIKDVEAVVSLIQRIAAASSKQTESSMVALEFMQKVSEAV